MAQTAAAKTTKKATTPKVPSDRKVKAAEEKVATRVEETPGWELLKDFQEVPIWDQMPLIQLLNDAMGDATVELSKEEFAALTPQERKEMQEGKRSSFDMTILGDLAKKLMDFAKDPAEYTKFCSGSGAMERSLNLAMAWVGQMGESTGSESS